MVKPIVASLVMLCAGAACAPLPETTPSVARASQISFIGEPELVRHSRIALSPSTQKALDRFKAEPYAFGAMFVRPDGGGWSWHADILTLEAAKHMAKTGCRIATGSNCVLYATLEPSTPPTKDALPRRLQQRIQDAKLETNPGGYLVVAANRTADIGYSWNYNSQSEARNAALGECKAATAGAIASRADDEVESRVDAELQQAGFFDCEIFGIYR